MSDDAQADDEGVLFDFAAEPAHDGKTLARYIRAHPRLADELVDLSLELRLRRASSNEVAGSDEAWIEASWTSFRDTMALNAVAGAETDPFVALNRDQLARMVTRLGLTPAALDGLRSRLVDVATIPELFLRAASAELGSSLETLRAFLAGPSAVATARFSSDGRRDLTISRISFEQLLIDAGVPQVDRAKLLAKRD